MTTRPHADHDHAHADHAREAVRRALDGKSGVEFWRSLDEVAQTDAFQQLLYNEFPHEAARPLDEVTRRNFLQVMGASLALAGVTGGCARQPEERIVPYVKAPEELVPGKPAYFASAFVMGGYAAGVLVENHMGRPTKIEGLPEHPSCLGATDAFAQASILGLYDPDRSKYVEYIGQVSTWDNFVSAMRGILDTVRPRGGEGVRILTETITSPSLHAQIDSFLKTYPNAKWHAWEPVNRDSVKEGARMAFGEYAETVYHFDKADVVVALDSDFLMYGPGHVRYAKDFAKRRDVVDHHGDEGLGGDGGHNGAALNRLYAFESTPTNTGSTADHRFRVRPSQIEAVARRLAQHVGVPALQGESGLPADLDAALERVAEDLKAHRGHGVVIAGDQQPAVVHALANAMNAALGNIGQTVTLITPVEARPVIQTESLRQLCDDMEAGRVELLLILGGNPVYSAPADFAFAERLGKVKTRVHLGLFVDETSELCHWHVPAVHYLETWGDARGHDGTVSLIQPLIAPLYDGKSPYDVLAALTEDTPRTTHEIVKDFWKSQRPNEDFDRFWAESLSEGMIANTAAPVKQVVARQNMAGPFTPPEQMPGLEIAFQPDPTIWDGRFANNAWLQELPKPLTKLTWDNAVIVGFDMAKRLGLADWDLVEVTYRDRKITGPILVQPGHCDDTITLHLGYGRTRTGKVGLGLGFNAYALRTSDSPGFGVGATVTKLNKKHTLARTEDHFAIEWVTETARRGLVRQFTQTAFEADPHIVHHGFHDPAHHDAEHPDRPMTLYKPEEKAYDGYAWGMTIDLNKCIGCGACITACQAENNIPVVGKDQVYRGREMHWIRVDRYYSGADMNNPGTHYQPVPCMQCENAPCEVVCPVGATQHSKEGLNDMVYNRCIGTRYCSNNCPYKVRRFNFYNYSRTPFGRHGGRAWPNYSPETTTEPYPESLKLLRNPDVTVRTRGVMEKCTYCVQRINLARIDAKKEGRAIRDGEIVPACQQACPSSAIVFGNINDPHSQVSQAKASHRNYAILADLNTRPRTTYLARLTNPNPQLES